MAFSTCVFVFLGLCYMLSLRCIDQSNTIRLLTVKILKFGTPQTIAIIVLKIEKFAVTLH